MGRLLKLIGIVIGALIVLVIAVGIGVALFFDPNDYKDQIAAAVGDATGRELTLEGDLELSVFPVLSISLGPATLSNAEGFGEQPFARIERAALDLELLPLLRRRVEVGQAQLDGLVLNLARDAEGRNNWQDLGGNGAADDASAAGGEDGGAPDVALNVEVVRVTNSEVNWNDAATGSNWTLGDFNFVASNFGPDAAFPLETSFTIAGDALRVAVSAETRATLSLANNAYRLDDLVVTLAGEGETWPGGRGDARLSFAAFTANLDTETLDLDDLTLEMLGVTVRGSLEGRQLLSNLTLDGAVAIAPFDPSAVLEVFDASIETADAAVLRRASAEARFFYDESRIGLEEMRLALDDSQLTGSVGLHGESLRFDLVVDQINADRYLPPEAEGEAVAEEGSLDEVDLPLEVLRTLDASGRLAFGQAQFAGMTLSDASFSLTAADGQVRLEPAANLYGGAIAGNILLEVQQDAARASLASELRNVDMLPLARDLLESEMVSGRGDLTLNLTTTGSNVGEMRRDLDGEVAFTIADGAWEGFDAWFELVRAVSVARGEGRPERPEGPRRTPFTSVSATGTVEDAILTNRDLNATLAFMTVDGEGVVNLLTDELDFDVVAMFLDGELLQSEPLMARLAGQQVPLRVTGTLAEPSILPDLRAMVSSEVRSAVDERVEEERSELEERVEQERSELEERLDQQRDEVREGLRNRLRGLLE